jgi:hypothetical protein
MVMDRFTKMAHFLPCTKAINSQETADLLMHEVFKHHGLPDDIISDRGPQFISKFWRHMFKLLHTCKFSSGYHPETNCQSERTNQTLEYLPRICRVFSAYLPPIYRLFTAYSILQPTAISVVGSTVGVNRVCK